jgi:hypothetical protein
MAAVLLAAWAGLCSAQSSVFDLQFDRVPVYELVRIVYAELLHESFVVDGSVARFDRVSSIDFRGATTDQVHSVLSLALEQQDLHARVVDSVNVVKSRCGRPDDRQVFTYQPNFRTTAYSESAIRALVSQYASVACLQGREWRPQCCRDPLIDSSVLRARRFTWPGNSPALLPTTVRSRPLL